MIMLVFRQALCGYREKPAGYTLPDEPVKMPGFKPLPFHFFPKSDFGKAPQLVRIPDQFLFQGP